MELASLLTQIWKTIIKNCFSIKFVNKYYFSNSSETDVDIDIQLEQCLQNLIYIHNQVKTEISEKNHELLKLA